MIWLAHAIRNGTCWHDCIHACMRTYLHACLQTVIHAPIARQAKKSQNTCGCIPCIVARLHTTSGRTKQKEQNNNKHMQQQAIVQQSCNPLAGSHPQGSGGPKERTRHLGPEAHEEGAELRKPRIPVPVGASIITNVLVPYSYYSYSTLYLK